MRLLISFTVSSNHTRTSVKVKQNEKEESWKGERTSGGDLAIHVVEARFELSEHRVDPVDKLVRRRDVRCLQCCVFARGGTSSSSIGGVGRSGCGGRSNSRGRLQR